MTLTSITAVIAAAKASNNRRLNSMAMTPGEIRAAEKAVARGLMIARPVPMPGNIAATFYCLA